jgi:ComF family protein
MKAILSLAAELAVAVVAPPRCAGCDGPAALLAVFCPACAAQVERPARTASSDVAAFVYGGSVARALTALKYGSRPDLARPMGDLLWRAMAPRAAELRRAVIVPVPLHAARLVERGFNQSALLAARVARHLGAPLVPRGLRRTRDTPRQAALDARARIANVAGAFAPGQLPALRGRDVVLVDDVATTGATLAAASLALRDAKVTRVIRAVVAEAQAEAAGAWPRPP